MMRYRTYVVLTALGSAVVLAGVSLGLAADPAPAGGETLHKGKSETIKKLFNGKNLDGWEGDKNLWSVKDGVIVGHNTGPQKVSTYLVTRRKYRDFRLTAKGKLGKQSEMHTGIAFWGRVAPEHGDRYTYAGHLAMFPSAYGMYDLYGRNGLPVSGEPAKKVGHQHDWNDLQILAQGNRVRVVINGTLVVDWRDPEPKSIHTGPIGLQLHQNDQPQTVYFKDLVLTTPPSDEGIPAKIGEKLKAAE